LKYAGTWKIKRGGKGERVLFIPRRSQKKNASKGSEEVKGAANGAGKNLPKRGKAGMV